MNGLINQGIPGLYTLGANDIFDYLASVLKVSFSLTSNISKPVFPSTKYTVVNFSICWINETSSNCERTIKTILTLLDLKRLPSVAANNFLSICFKVAKKESPRWTLPMLIPHVHMLFCKFHSKMEKNYSEKYLLSIWRVMRGVPITWTWENKPESMVLRSTNLCCLSKNVSGL